MKIKPCGSMYIIFFIEKARENHERATLLRSLNKDYSQKKTENAFFYIGIQEK